MVKDAIKFVVSFSFADDGLVNIGKALWFGVEIFKQDRRSGNEHLDVLILLTDSMSDDEVLAPSLTLRSMGIMVSIFTSKVIVSARMLMHL